MPHGVHSVPRQTQHDGTRKDGELKKHICIGMCPYNNAFLSQPREFRLWNHFNFWFSLVAHNLEVNPVDLPLL